MVKIGFQKTLKKGPPHRPVLDPKIGLNLVRELLKIGSNFGSVFGPILGSLLEQFWEPSGPQDRHKRRQKGPKSASQSSQKRKRLFAKKWFSCRTVCIFSLLRPRKTAPKGPEGCRRGFGRASRLGKKESQN